MKTVTFIHTSDMNTLQAVQKELTEGYGKGFENKIVISKDLEEPEEDFLKTQCIQFQVKYTVEGLMEADTIIIDTSDWNPYTWFTLGMAYKVAWEKNRKEFITVGNQSLAEIQKHLEQWVDTYKTWVSDNPIEFDFKINRASDVLSWVRLGFLWGDQNNNYVIVTKLQGKEQSGDYILKFLSTRVGYYE